MFRVVLRERKLDGMLLAGNKQNIKCVVNDNPWFVIYCLNMRPRGKVFVEAVRHSGLTAQEPPDH